MQKITAAVTRLWNARCLGKIAIGFIGLFVIGCCMVALAGRRAPQQTIAPTTVAIAPAAAAPIPTTEPTIAPTAVPPSPTLEPTLAPTDIPASPEPTSPPVPTIVIRGVAPVGAACPSEAPIKGNIVDRGARKGDKIYHVPGSAAYDKTKPERCFATVAEAESAGYRAPTK